MEKSLEHFRELFGLEEPDIRTYSPLTLAYIGDAVYELVIRTLLVEKGNTQVNKLNQRANRLVKASAQSEMIEKLKTCLTEEEMSIFRRGRNAKSYTMAKNATMSDYRRATGFEALMGYLYLTEQWGRILELVKLGLQEGEEDGEQIPGK
ncbi:MAG TPA: ribonuclease III [Candidatus Blautia stercoripullorum]|uniref:Mini-ribonuclease 3 n=1 Tax=Candidatus Blautia stercoripullorum TaxID=2838502 RepID=A0A9D2R5D2_9FIRM|nr:ribonuclease III [Candidatus Blautia stercoripullorum]